MPEALTERQAQVLEFIEGYIAEHAYPPTNREVSEACGLGGNSGAHRMLLTLVRKGYLARGQGRCRTLSVVAPEVGQSELDPSEETILAWVGAAHTVIRNLELQAAPLAADPSATRLLITAALTRHDRAEALLDSPGRPDDPRPYDALLRLGHGLSRPEGPDHWARFVADYAVLNRAAVAVFDRLADESSRLTRLLRPDAQLCRRMSDAAQEWWQALEGTDAGLLTEEARVAELVLQEVVWAAPSADSGRRLLTKTLRAVPDLQIDLAPPTRSSVA